MKNTIHTTIVEALSTLGVSDVDFAIEHPQDPRHGEFTSNVALVAAKSSGKKPYAVAQHVADVLKERIPEVTSVDVAGPGFINITMTREYYHARLKDAYGAGPAWGQNDSERGQRIMVEYTDPNPFKELHIGHLVPNALGEALASLYEASGAEVRRVTFQGDVGMHVAKAMFGLQKAHVTPDAITPEVLGRAYAEGSALFEADGAAQEAIKALNKIIYDKSDPGVALLYDAGKAVSLAYFEKAYTMLGTKFDHNFFESVTGPIGHVLVMDHLGTVFTKSDGAIIYEGEKKGFHTRVFVNAQGLPTYEAKDVGLAKAKYDWWPFDCSITVTGTEQQQYFTVVASAISDVLPDLAGKIDLLPNGMLRLTEGKMSSRTGNVVRALDLIEDVMARVREVMGDREVSHKDEVVRDVAVGAIKYSILRSAAGKDIVFDLTASVSLDGDSGPYLQYAHARASSVIGKAEGMGIVPSGDRYPDHVYDIEPLLLRFPDILLRASRERAPHHLVTYLIELASAWNSFYAKERIADPDDQYAGYKLLIAQVLRQSLRRGLTALGIKAPVEM
jgi:arginyl-tRNA synthetase